MRADGSLRPTKPPRALPLTTGEDTPAGQSLRARLLVLEVSKGDVDAGLLADLQAAAGKGLLAQAMAGYVRWLAPQLEAVQKELRETALAWRERSLAHRRTADLLGSLAAAHGIFRRFAVEVGALTQAEADELGQRVDAALLEAGGAQAVLQRSEDPVTRFLDLLRGCLSSGRAHLIALDGEDPAPAEPEHWGWRMIPPPPYEGNPEKAPGPRFAPLGDRIGWIDGADLFLDPEAAYAAVQSLAARQTATLAVKAQTLWKRLDERGLIASPDPGHFTTRIMVSGKRRRVLHLLAETLYPTTDQADVDRLGGPLSGPAEGEAVHEEAGNGPEERAGASSGPDGPGGPDGPLLEREGGIGETEDDGLRDLFGEAREAR